MDNSRFSIDDLVRTHEDSPNYIKTSRSVNKFFVSLFSFSILVFAMVDREWIFNRMIISVALFSIRHWHWIDHIINFSCNFWVISFYVPDWWWQSIDFVHTWKTHSMDLRFYYYFSLEILFFFCVCAWHRNQSSIEKTQTLFTKFCVRFFFINNNVKCCPKTSIESVWRVTCRAITNLRNNI